MSKRLIKNTRIKTLLVDGDNLFKIGFFGVKNFYNKGKHVGAIYHFLNTIKKHIELYRYDKIVVFWDGENNSHFRKKIYLHYKDNRKANRLDDEKLQDMEEQKIRVKLYLEELFVRQGEYENCETDDAMAFYCQNSPNEDKVIFSSDKDLTQLIDDHVKVFSPRESYLYEKGDKIQLNKDYVPHYNVAMTKILIGDKSDNIDGIYYLGEKTLLKLFPEISEQRITVEEIMEKAEELLKENKNNNTLKNLLSGKTKRGVFGEEFITINKKLVDLSEPLLTDEAKTDILLLVNETLDPEGRGWKNVMKMMHDDGLFQFLPKNDMGWTDFFLPLLKLARSEKKQHNKNI